MRLQSGSETAWDRVECVVFDVDDTLYLERDYVHSGFLAVEANEQIPGLADVCWRLFCSGGRGDTFNSALVWLGVEPSESRITSLVSAYRNHHPSIELLPDARACLDALSGRPLACVTDGRPESQRAKVAALGLEQWLNPIILTSEFGAGFDKPHPRAFEVVQRSTRLPPAAHVYVADNPAKDFGGPESLGWATVRLRRTGSLWESVTSGEDVDAELRSLDELVVLLDRGRRHRTKRLRGRANVSTTISVRNRPPTASEREPESPEPRKP